MNQPTAECAQARHTRQHRHAARQTHTKPAHARTTKSCDHNTNKTERKTATASSHHALSEPRFTAAPTTKHDRNDHNNTNKRQTTTLFLTTWMNSGRCVSRPTHQQSSSPSHTPASLSQQPSPLSPPPREHPCCYLALPCSPLSFSLIASKRLT